MNHGSMTVRAAVSDWNIYWFHSILVYKFSLHGCHLRKHGRACGRITWITFLNRVRCLEQVDIEGILFEVF